jgi:hypothetical protein
MGTRLRPGGGPRRPGLRRTEGTAATPAHQSFRGVDRRTLPELRMKGPKSAAMLLSLSVVVAPLRADPGNPAIDALGHLRVATEAFEHRATRRVDEAEFLRMAREPGTVVLDARSAQLFALMHIDGAINLPFPDLAQATLDTLLPDRGTRILIYCNNNFRDEPRAFPTKLPTASLNLSTYAALYDYGYRNLYELAPVVDPAATLLPLAGSLVAPARPSQVLAQQALPNPPMRR